MKKKTICLLIALVLIVAAVLFFTVPRSLLLTDDIQYISVERYNGTGSERITEQLDLEALKEQLMNSRCRRIIDSTYNYFAEDARYEITVVFDSRGPLHILLGEPDEKGQTTLMNKAYFSADSGIFPKLCYRVLEPESLIAYLDSCLQ